MIRTFAQALTSNQTQVVEMLSGVNASINNLGLEKLKEMFDQTFAAMDAMDNFRAKSIDVMGQNNAMMKEKLARADKYIVHTR